MANIKFEIFRNRKKFKIVNWLKAREDKSYESFVSFLESKSVVSPGEEYFKKALNLVESMAQREKDFQSDKVEEVKVEKKETIPIDVEVVIPSLEKEIKVESKPETKTRRRRRKKSQSES